MQIAKSLYAMGLFAASALPVAAGSMGEWIPPGRPESRHPMTIEETLALRKPTEVEISPDGTKVAYVVTQPIVQTNKDRAVLYAGDATSTHTERELAEGIVITAVHWSVDGRSIFFLLDDGKGKEIWRASPKEGRAERLTKIVGELVCVPAYRATKGAVPYQISADGKTLVYAVYDIAEARRQFESRTQGSYLYRGEWYDQRTNFQWQPAPYQLWKLDLLTGAAAKLWEIPLVTPPGYDSPEIQISPNGQTLAVLFQVTEDERYSLDLLDLTGPQKQPQPFLSNLARTINLQWSKDGESLVFDSWGEYQADKPHAEDVTRYAVRLSDRVMKPEKESAVASMLGEDSVTKAVEQKFGDLVHDCSISASKARAACIKEAPMLAPEVVSVPLKDASPDSKPLVLTHLNPEYDAIQLGQVSELSWEGPKGQPGPQAGLILPVGYVPGKRYPLIVMLYNAFSGRNFIHQAHLFTSFPAQALAGHGYTVLLMNLPEGHGVYKDGDFKSARATGIDDVVSALRSAIDTLAKRGIVDTNRMGIMGWSHGSFCTDYIVTHFPDWFRAASSGEGGGNSPAGFWLTNDFLRTSLRGFFGGGPYGSHLPHWQELSPVFSAERLRIPLLMEYSNGYLSSLEFYQAIINQGGQAELVVYPREDHVFLQPRNRFNSMTRQYDWFNFWLLGEEDADPSKREQYTRWREMREKLKSEKIRTANHAPSQ